MSKVEPNGRSNLECALDYAAKGFYVFPLYYVLRDGGCSCRAKQCKRIGKHPTTRNGVLDATTDVDQISRWWGAMPHANIGIATGHELPGGGLLIVVDVDTDDAKGKKGAVSLAALVAEHGELPETLTQRTGSGGTHYFFRTSKPYKNDSTGRIGKDIDCRCLSGYVVVPNSNHYSGGRYEWLNWGQPVAEMPVWIGANLVVDGEEPAPGKKGKAKKTGKVDVTADAGESFEEEDTKQHEKLTRSELVKILKSIPGDVRDVWWKIGAALKTELGDDGFDVWDEWSQASDKYDAKIQQVQWRSFKPGELSVGTIIHFAKENGWRGFDKEAADDPAIRENWIFCVGTKEFIELNSTQRLDCEQFSYRFAPNFKRGRASDHVLRNEGFPRVDGLTFWPDHPQLVQETGLNKLNLWRPSAVTPAPGDVSLFLEHLTFILPDLRERERIFLPYLAWLVKHPGMKIRWAVVLQGKQRTGKSYFGRLLERVLGEHNVKRPTNERLHETWTDWQEGAQLIVIEELMGFGRKELINKLKPKITDETTSVRLPGGREYQMPNRYNFLMFTNHKGALPIDDDDRRYCLLFSPAERRPDSYYDALWAWSADERNIAAVTYYLENEVDVSGFRPNSNAPETDARSEAIDMNRSDLDVFITDSIRASDGLFACDLVVVEHIRKVLPDHIRPQDATRNAVSGCLERAGAKQVGRMPLPGAYPRAWAIRNIERWQASDEGKRAKEYRQFLEVASGLTIQTEDDKGDIIASMLMKVSQRGKNVSDMVREIGRPM
ncbi:MAG: bifunctional DNA primase/polymerase [Acidobacteriia bacterium]|nr:bifunctional DNA primase/polymerase [Terriglobia bacterium]